MYGIQASNDCKDIILKKILKQCKDTVTSFFWCDAPIDVIAPTVPAYGHFPPSSWSEPTVNSHPGITFAAKTGAQISFSDMIYVCSSMFLFGSNSTAIIYIYISTTS
jgi:hypothetical protein